MNKVTIDTLEDTLESYLQILEIITDQESAASAGAVVCETLRKVTLTKAS